MDFQQRAAHSPARATRKASEIVPEHFNVVQSVTELESLSRSE